MVDINWISLVMTQLIIVAVILIGILVVRLRNSQRGKNEEAQLVSADSSKTEVEKSDKSSIPLYDGELLPELTEFIYGHENTMMQLKLTFDAYQSLDIMDWINGNESEAILWFTIEHDHGGTELGFLRDDRNLHINNCFPRAVTISGYFNVNSIQGPKDGWISVTLRTAA